jgi:uncharacterized delta-60 repeat protein
MRNPRFLLFGTLALAVLLVTSAPTAAAPGDLDATFGGDGVVVTSLEESGSGGVAVALQADGKILVAGAAYDDPPTYSRFGVARYLANGTADSTFGISGRAMTQVGVGGGALGLAITPGNKIVLAGTVAINGCTGPLGGSTCDAFGVARINPDGSMDTDFGGTGQAITSIGAAASKQDDVYSVAIQADGKIVLAGWSWNGSDYDVALVRYEEDGTLDSTFGTGGKVTTALTPGEGNSDVARAAAIQPDGKIVIAGASITVGNQDFALARYNTDGTLDGAFGSGGKVITDFGEYDSAAAVALQPDGRIVAAGASWTGWALARYKPDGTLDSAFGTGGKVYSSFRAGYDLASAIAIQVDGRIVAAGYVIDAGSAGGEPRNIALRRYEPDGSLDTTFSGDGMAMTDLGDQYDHARAVALQTDGKIVIAGGDPNWGWGVILARYDGDGFKQRHPAWGSDHLATDPECSTIASEGCALTSAANVFAYYGTQELTEGYGVVNPGNLNEWLDDHAGYDGCAINWCVADNATGGHAGNPEIWRSWHSLAERTQAIDDALDHDKLPIVQVRNRWGGPHWIVLSGRSGDSYTIMDPDGPSGGKLSDTYGAFYDVVVYSKETATPCWSVVGHSPVQLLVTDPLGRRAGYDPSTGTISEDMPLSSYGVEAGTGDDDGLLPPLPDRPYFEQSESLGGTYSIQAIGIGDGPYELIVTHVADSGETTEQILTGIAAPGSVDVFQVQVQGASPVGGVAELPDASNSSGENYLRLAALVALASLAIAAVAWHARRRWLR